MVQIESLIPTMIESLENNQIVELKVSGNSMNPTLLNNVSIVGLERYIGPLHKHRIYFYRYNDKYILHRYIRTKKELHYFRGDALKKCEILKDDSNVFAYVKYIQKEYKKINPYSFFRLAKLYTFLTIKKVKGLVRKLVKRND